MQPNKEHAVDCACGCRYPSLDLTEVYVTSAQSRCPCFLVSTPYFSPSRLVFMSTKSMVEPEHGEPITKHAHNRTHAIAHALIKQSIVITHALVFIVHGHALSHASAHAVRRSLTLIGHSLTRLTLPTIPPCHFWNPLPVCDMSALDCPRLQVVRGLRRQQGEASYAF